MRNQLFHGVRSRSVDVDRLYVLSAYKIEGLTDSKLTLLDHFSETNVKPVSKVEKSCSLRKLKDDLFFVY